MNRLPVLFLPGDIFAGRRPDPVLQQVEDFGDGTVSVNDCFKPVSRYWDRITHPAQLVSSLPQLEESLKTLFKRKSVPIWVTEYGHQTKPPDPLGVSPG